MIKAIVVPIDIAEKEAGTAALGLARDLAKTLGGKLILLNVVEQVSEYVAARVVRHARCSVLVARKLES